MSNNNSAAPSMFALQQLLVGQPLPAEYDYSVCNGCGDDLQTLNNELAGGGPEAFSRMYAYLRKRNQTLDWLGKQVSPASSQEQGAASTVQASRENTVVPPLSVEVKANERLAHEASPTLDAMIEYLDHWCTRSYEGYTQAVALWILTTIAARRLQLQWRQGIWTPLYILLVAESTAYAKSEAASYGDQIIRECGLGFLLAPDDFSPQKLINIMARPTVPLNYGSLDAERQEYIRLNAAFSGQKGWLYDEIGNKMQNIINSRGPEAVLYQLLKQLYDCKKTYSYATIARGIDSIDMPYLSIIGTATPSCLKPIVANHKEVFDDGFFARFAFVVPPAGTCKTKLAPKGYASVPVQIIQQLIEWHNRLGIPVCEIINTEEEESNLDRALGAEKKQGKDKKGIGNREPYEIKKGDLPQTIIGWDDEVYGAYEAYSTNLIEIANDPENNLDERFKSFYGRLPEKTLRIAMVLASTEGFTMIQMRHWARGQQFMEHLRHNYHELINQLYNGESPSSYGDTEDLIVDYLSKQEPGILIHPRDVAQHVHALKKIGAPAIRDILNDLASSNPESYVVEGRSKHAKFRLKTETERSQGKVENS